MSIINTAKYGLIRTIVKILNPRQINACIADKTARLGHGGQYVKCKIGRYTYINGGAVVYADIGAFCSISGGCVIGGGAHPIDRISTSPLFHQGRNVFKKHFYEHEFEPFKRTIIGNDVWIGANCLVKGGITIGDGAIVGMGSVVTKNIEPYTIVGGDPAKIIRKRFSDDIINILMDIKWWNWNDEKIKHAAKYINNTDEFIRYAITT